MIRRQFLRCAQNSCAAFLIVSAFLGLAVATSEAQGTFTAPTTAVGSNSATQTVTVTITTAGTLTSVSVLTRGATGLDYTAVTPNGATAPCSTGTMYHIGDTCAVQVVFSPTRPFTRYGSVSLFDATGTLLGNSFLNGVGTGAQLSYPLGATSATAAMGTGFTTPSGIAVDATGNVYVADTGNNAVKEIKFSDGSTVAIGSGFSAPTAVAVDGAGNIYVADTGNNQIKEIVAVNGAIGATPTILTLGTGFSGPKGVAVDGSGNVFVADTGHAAVKEILAVNGVIPATTPTINTLGTGFTTPVSVAVDASGNVYVADTSKTSVTEITSTSTMVNLGSGLSSPQGVAVDGLGDVYVGDSGNNAVKELVAVSGTVPTTSPTIVALGSGYSGPLGVAVSSAGNVYVADTGNNAVKKLTDQISPGVSFASTVVGATSSDSPKTVTLLDFGNAALTFAAPSSGSTPTISTNFLLGGAGTCPQVASGGTAASLASGSTCTYSISFKPLMAGPLSGQLNLGTLNAPGASTTVALSGTGTAGTPTVTVGSPTTTVDSTSVTLTASVTYAGVPPAGAFTFSVNGGTAITGTCTGGPSPMSCTATYNPSSLTVGTYSIQGALAADTNYNSASGSGTLTLTMVTPTVSVITTGSPSVVNGSVTFTASIAPTAGVPPTGTISFTTTLNSATTPISGCTALALSGTYTASCPTSGLAAGSNSITATYSGDTNFASASGSVSQVVNKATPGITVATSGSPTTVDQPVTFTATVTPNSGVVPSGGTVSFSTSLNGGTVTVISGCSTQTLSGTTTFTATCQTSALLAGSNSITATYVGDTNFNSATSAAITQTVNQANVTAAVTSSGNPSTVDQSVTFTATLSGNPYSFTTAPGGTVSFTANGVAISGCSTRSVTSGAATCMTSSLVAPADTIVASYSGDANFIQATSPQFTQNVTKNTPVISASSSLPTAVVNQTVTFTATITPAGASSAGITPTTSVTFAKGGTAVCTAVVTPAAGGTGTASCSVAFTSVFSATNITATYSGDSNFVSGNVATVTQTVLANQSVTTASSNLTQAAVNQTVNLSATFGPTTGSGFSGSATPQSGTVTFSDSLNPAGSPFCTTTVTAGSPDPVTCPTTFTTTGSHVITATFTSSDTNFNGSSGQVTVSVTSTAQNLAFNTPSPSSPKVNQAVSLSASFLNPGSATATGTYTYADSLSSSLAANCSGTVSNVTSIPACTDTVLVAGTHVITLTFTAAGGSGFSSTSSTLNLIVTQNTPTVAVTSPTTGTTDQQLTFTATVTPSVTTPASTGATLPTGTVTFSRLVNSVVTPICTATVTSSNGVATCPNTVPFTAVGPYQITATYSGDTSFASAASTASTLTISQTGTTLAYVAPPNPATPAVNQSASYTVQFGLTNSVNDSGLTTPSGNITFADSANPTVVLCAVAAPASGTVSCAFPLLTAGAHSLVAKYAGDTNFSASMVTFSSPSILADPTTTAVASNLGQVNVNQSLNLTTSLTPTYAGGATAQGSVVLTDSLGSGQLCTATVTNGVVTPGSCSVSFTTPGSHVITAAFTSSDSNFSNSSGNVTVMVTSASQTLTFNTTSPASPTVDQAVSISASFAMPGSATATGTYTYTDSLSSSLSASCSGSVTAMTAIPACIDTVLVGGTHVITLTFTATQGSSGFASTSSTLNLIVAQNTPTVAVTSPTTGTTDQQLTFIATVTPATTNPASTGGTTPTGTVTFSRPVNSVTTAICTATVTPSTGVATCPNTVAFTSVGTYPITATYSGDSSFASATSATSQLTVTQTGTTLAYTSPTNPASPAVNQLATYTVQFGLTNSVSANGLTAPSGNITFTDQANPSVVLCTVAVPASGPASCTFPLLTSGSHTLLAKYAGDSNFSGSMVTFASPSIQADPTTTIVNSNLTQINVNQSVNLTTTLTPTYAGVATAQGGVALVDSLSGPLCTATVINGVISPSTCSPTFTTPGNHVITATFTPSDSNFTTSSGMVTVMVTSASQTLQFKAPSPANPTVNQVVTVAASFANPGSATATGTYMYTDSFPSSSLGNTCSGSVTAATSIPACNITVVAAGTHVITVSFSATPGMSGFATTSNTQNVTVGSTTTTVSVPTISPSSAIVGQTVSFTATVMPTILPSPAPTTTMSPTGTVTFTYGTTPTVICTAPLTGVAGGTATATCTQPFAKTGTYAVSATYQPTSSDPNFTGSASSTASITVSTASPTVTVTSSSRASGGVYYPVASQSVMYTAVVTGVTNGAVPTGTITFSLAGSAYSCTPSAAPGAVNSSLTQSCTTTIPISVVGSVLVTATYSGDSNYAGAPGTAMQLVQNFTAGLSPTSIIMVQGNTLKANTNTTDPFSSSTITLAPTTVSAPPSSTGISADPIGLSGCTGDVAGLTCTVSSGTAGTVTVTADSTVQIGSHTITVIEQDTANTGLTHPVTETVIIVAQPATVIVIAKAGSVATGFFTVSPVLVQTNSSFACSTGTVAIGNPDGSFTVSSKHLSDLGLTCGTVTKNPSVTNGYMFTLTTSGVTTTSRLEMHTTEIYAALLGAPFLLLFGVLPGFGRRRKALSGVVCAVLLAIVALPVTGCGGGGFTPTPSAIAQPGTYLIQIVDNANKNVTVAEVPVTVGNF